MNTARYTALACGYLGIAAAQVINPRVEGDEFVLIYDQGIQGGPKVRIPLETLDDLAIAKPELDIGESETEEEKPSSLKSLLLSKMARPSVDDIDDEVAVENPNWDGKQQAGLLEVTIDATDGAVRLIDEHRLDPADILDFIGDDRRINARDVRAFIEAAEGE